MPQPRHYTLLKWCILCAAYTFLCYKLVDYAQHNSLAVMWQQLTVQHLWWIVGAMLLWPLNWGIEAAKWQLLTHHLTPQSYGECFKAVLGGVTVGFFTPNRIGEYPGRALFVPDSYRPSAIALGVVGTLAQTLAIALIGLPAAILFFAQAHTYTINPNTLYPTLTLITISLVVLYCLLPQIARAIAQRTTKVAWANRIAQHLHLLSTKQLTLLLLLSTVRYATFCTQLYFALRCFDIALTPAEAFIGIACNYLFVTVTPSLALSEVAIRGSYAVIFIGHFTPNTLGVASASICLWLLNYCTTMIAGSIIVARSKWR